MTVEPRSSWSRRWLDELVGDDPTTARPAQRGRALARRGAVTAEPAAGRISARVHEHRGRPVEVAVSWPTPDDAAWEEAVARLAAELRFTAALLDGVLPEGIEDLLATVGVHLLPPAGAVDQRCSCGQAQPCAHVAAAHTVVAAQIDRDPFLLLALQGRTRDRLLRELRARRAGDDAPAGPELDTSKGLFGARGDLDAIELHPRPVDDAAALLLHLGPPPGMTDGLALAPLVERAAATAWRLASGDGANAADEELLLAELRAQRVGTVESLADALGRDATELRVDLDRLYERGTVMRTGSGADARYRAAASVSASS